MCEYCENPKGNRLKLDTLSADGFSFQKIYIEQRTITTHDSSFPEERFCLVAEHCFMQNSCTTVTPIDYCPFCSRKLEVEKIIEKNESHEISEEEVKKECESISIELKNLSKL
jgi:hypothetical protein